MPSIPLRVRLKREVRLAASPLTQNHWALKLGFSRGHWSEIVNGKHPYPSPRTRERASSSRLNELLFRTSARDPVVFGLTGLLVLVIALAASIVPGRRATRVDPLSAIRAE